MKFNILIVVAKFWKSRDLTDNLLLCAKEKLMNGFKAKRKSKLMNFKFNVIEVPGSFEIPVVISRNIKKYDGFVALGCIIKGDTPHFEYISQSITNAIMNLSVISKKPIGNGILTTLNYNQAKERSLKKGQEAVEAVISVLSQ